MAYVIEILNRWTRNPGWDAALAREAADEAVALAPANPRALHARAHVALIDGEHVSAYLGFKAALSRDPCMARARIRMGIIEMELGRPERTSFHVREALETSEADEELRAQAYFVQGMAAFHLGDDAESRAMMKRVLSLQPNSGLTHQWLAAIDALHGRPESSALHLEAFNTSVPGHTIESLWATERSRQPSFVEQRGRFYTGLKIAGLP